jgi:hypothetical protein
MNARTRDCVRHKMVLKLRSFVGSSISRACESSLVQYGRSDPQL